MNNEILKELSDGELVKINSLYLFLRNNDELVVAAFTNYIFTHNITKRIAEKEVRSIETEFCDLLKNFPEFKAF